MEYSSIDELAVLLFCRIKYIEMSRILGLLFLLHIVSSCTDSDIEFTELPYHSSDEGRTKSVLVSNIPKDTSAMLSQLIEYYKKNSLDFYKSTMLDETSVFFYEKNEDTQYFLEYPDDPGGFSSKNLFDYFYGENGMRKAGLAIIAGNRNPNISSWIFKIYFFDNNGMIVSDTLLDEAIPDWYKKHKKDILVYQFNKDDKVE